MPAIKLNQVRSAGFMNGVCVDSVFMKVVRAFEGGVKEVCAHERGIRIFWNQGSVLVPWGNVAYVDERTP